MSRAAGTILCLHSQKQRISSAVGVSNGEAASINSIAATGGKPFLTTDQPGGAGKWSLVGVSAVVETTTTTLNLSEPAGCAAGDILVACLSMRTTATTSVTLPSGWTRISERLINNTVTTSSASPSSTMAYIVRGASAPALGFTLPAGISVAEGTIVAYRGGSPEAPEASSAVGSATAITAVSVTGIQTMTEDDLIVAMTAGGQEGTYTNFNATSPAGGSGGVDTISAPGTVWTKRVETVTTSGADTSIGVFDAVKATPGATGNFTVTASVSAGYVVAAAAFVITPAATRTVGDDFERANAALESSKTATGTDGGWDWGHDGFIASGMTISGGKLACGTTNTTGSAYKTAPVGSADHKIEYQWGGTTTDETGSFFCCRLRDRNNFVGFRCGAALADSKTGIIEVYRRVAGTLTALRTTVSGEVAANDVVRLECEGTNWRVYKNGTSFASGAIGDASLTNNTGTGVVGRNNSFAVATYMTAGPLAAGAVNVTVNVTGNALASAVGDVIATGASPNALAQPTGNALTSAVGDATGIGRTPITVIPTSNALTAYVGDVTVKGGAKSIITSAVGMSSAVGQVTAAGATSGLTTLNPLDKKSDLVVLSNGNLTATGTDTGGNNWVRSTSAKTGKRYVEFTATTVANSVFGIADLSAMTFPGANAKSFGLFYHGFGSINGTFPDWLTAYASGNVVGMAVDLTAGLVWWRTGAGNWNGSGTANPATGAGGFSIAAYTGTPHHIIVSGDNGHVATVNFGATAFANAAPSGFVAWDALPPTNVTVIPTGQALTSAVDQVTATGKVIITLASQVATTAVGQVTVVGKANVTATGNALAASVGDVTAIGKQIVTVQVTGNALTTAVGTVTVNTASLAQTAGNALVSAVGDVTVVTKSNVVVVPASQALAASVGQVTVATTLKVVVIPTGQVLTPAVGSPTFALGTGVSVVPASQQLVVSTATPTVTGKAVVQPTGNQLTITGTGASVSAGGSLSVGVTGNLLTSAVGSVTIVAKQAVTAQPTNNLLTTAVGNVTISAKINIVAQPAGNALTSFVGSPIIIARQVISAPVTGQQIAISAGSATVAISTGGIAGVKIWSGSAWVSKPAKVWSGSAWTQKPVKYWNGTAWVGGAPPPPFSPADYTGLCVWIDASQLVGADGSSVSPWQNLVPGGAHGYVPGGAVPPKLKTNALNGRSVVHINALEGRFVWDNGTTGVTVPYTVIFVAAKTDLRVTTARVVGAVYPPQNLLMGYYTNFDQAYVGYFIGTPRTPVAGEWNMYSMDSAGSSRFWRNGVPLPGGGGGENHWGGSLVLGGYDPTVAYDPQSCDADYAELVMYNRKLTDVERVTVENYLRDKWLVSELDYMPQAPTEKPLELR